jgi:hypothetical protein
MVEASGLRTTADALNAKRSTAPGIIENTKAIRRIDENGAPYTCVG